MGIRGRKSMEEKRVNQFIAAHPPKSIKQANSAPAHLGKHGAAFWLSMRDSYAIDEPGAVAVLTRAAECIDTIQQARAAMAKDGGPIIANQYDIPKLHPAITSRRRRATVSTLR
jgi:hypothetical protein